MTKKLRKAIMTTSRFENKYRREKTEGSKLAYKKQKNYTNRLCKKEKKKFLENLDFSDRKQVKQFWKTLSPFFMDKGNGNDVTTLVHNGKIINDSQEIADTFNEFFEKAVDGLGITENGSFLTDASDATDKVEKALKKFKNHPSILRIKSSVPITGRFEFQKITVEDILLEIEALKEGKAVPKQGPPTKFVKDHAQTLAPTLKEIFNIEVIDKAQFSNKLKLADITAIFKKLEKLSTKNYRPVSILPVISKIFEKILNKQMYNYVDSFLSKYVGGYRKKFCTEYTLISMIEKWKDKLDKGGFAGGILMDLSKAFVTINHELLIAKLGAYGFGNNALAILQDYLSNRWQRTRVGLKYSSWAKLIKGVPQGSILGPILFNIYLNDLFYIITNSEVCNLADDTTPFFVNWIWKYC